MKLLEPGATLDGFTIEERIHSGGMAHIYRVVYADSRPPPAALARWAAARGGGHHHPARRGAGPLGPRAAPAKHRAPGPEPRQCAAARGWQRGAAGLWPLVPRALPRPAGRAIAQGRGLTRLDRSRAGGGGARRPTQRCVCHRRHALPAVHWRAALWHPTNSRWPAPAFVGGPHASAKAARRPPSLAARGGAALPGARGRQALPLGGPPGL